MPECTGFLLLFATTIKKNHLLPGPLIGATPSQGLTVRPDSNQQEWFPATEAEPAHEARMHRMVPVRRAGDRGEGHRATHRHLLEVSCGSLAAGGNRRRRHGQALTGRTRAVLSTEVKGKLWK